MGEEKIKELKNKKSVQIRLLCFLALSSSLTAVILMLASPMYGIYFMWGIHVLIYAVSLLVIFFISISGIITPDKMKKKIVLVSIFIPFSICAITWRSCICLLQFLGNEVDVGCEFLWRCNL